MKLLDIENSAGGSDHLTPEAIGQDTTDTVFVILLAERDSTEAVLTPG
jgi:hypothetical protein